LRVKDKTVDGGGLGAGSADHEMDENKYSFVSAVNVSFLTSDVLENP